MFKNMKIGKKLMITFILVAIISSIGGVVGLSAMTNMNSNYSRALSDYGFSQGDIGLFNSEFNESRAELKDLMILTNLQSKQTHVDNLDKINAEVTADFTKMKKGIIGEKELSYYNDIKDNLNQYAQITTQVVDLAKQNSNNQAYAIMIGQATPLSDKIRASTEALISLKTKTGNELAGGLTSQNQVGSIAIICVIIAALLASVLIAIFIARSISKPAMEMADAANRLAAGDLSVLVKVDSTDEIGQLGAALSKTIQTLRGYIDDIKIGLAQLAQGDLNISEGVEFKGDFIELRDSIINIAMSLSDTFAQINQASAQVSSGSEQVSDGAQALAQGATEQASSIEELSASITEISSHVSKNAVHAAEADANVILVGSEINISSKYMDEMIIAMSQINDSSSKIGKIIKTIEDIAFQTNILALNAAVEAARAGAAGKGFAVVADEVRNLASKSAEAAKDTTALIENSMKQVENGTRIADQTAKSLVKVVAGAKVVENTVNEISKASSQQSEAISQITLGVDQISNVVQTNSATAEESAAASEELSGQAQVLQALITKFKLRNQDNHLDSKPTQQQTEINDVYSQGSKY